MGQDSSASGFGAPPFAAEELLEGLLEGVVIHGADGRVAYCNPSAARLLQVSRQRILESSASGMHWTFLNVFGQALSDEEFPANRILAGEERLAGLVLGVDKGDGKAPVWLLVSAFARTVDADRYAVVSFVDTRTPLGFSFRDLVEMSGDAVLVTDCDFHDRGPRIVYANPAFEALTGYSVEFLLGKPPSFLQGPGSSETARREIREALRAGKPVRRDMLNYARDGRSYWVDIQIAPVRDVNGELTHFVAVQRDITAAHEEAERLVYEASHDPLTGLLNRRGFADHAALLLSQAQRLRQRVALLMLDIDHFKEVNDCNGHEAGDQLLQCFADTLRQRLRASDVVTRLGGDEFAVLLSLGSEACAGDVADAIRESTRLAFEALGAPDQTRVSIGLA